MFLGFLDQEQRETSLSADNLMGAYSILGRIRHRVSTSKYFRSKTNDDVRPR
jgi:hypothetical protein